ncbi:MAG: ABC transporter permease [Lewinellaceae bacterium]|nr:ABC transporter permease [Lewinellaceae bacterium]
MWQNYLKIAWRNLLRNRSYALVNILGLAVGLACFMFIILYVQDELSYDRWQERGDRIYRMALERKYPGRSRHYAIIPPGYGEVLKKEFPEVEEACRLFFFEEFGIVLKRGSEVFKEEQVVWADSSFFELFSIPLLKGDARTVLARPNTAVLTEKLAKKYFGDENPVGKVLEQPQAEQGLEVTGVCADVPENSHLRFGLLVSSATLDMLAGADAPNFVNFSAYTYLLLHPGASPEQLERKFPELVVKYASGQVLSQFGVNYEEYQRQGNGYRYFLQPLPDIYLDSKLEAEIRAPGSRRQVYFFTAIALLILVIASINFMNLATARSAGRAREVGIRKTLGSSRSAISLQFFAEALLIGLVSGVLAYGINLLALGPFNDIAGKAMPAERLYRWPFLLTVAGAAAATGLLSGIYPALALSAFRPVEVLRGKAMQQTKGVGLRNALVAFQFSISIFLIACTIVVYRQLAFTQNKDLGFDKEQVVSLKGADNLDARENETFKEALSKLPGVAAVSGCSSQPGQQYFGISFQPPGAEEMTTGSGLIVDEGYVECMSMKLAAGRSFSEAFADSLSILVNEAAVREMGLENPVGARLTSPDGFLNKVEGERTVYTIIGVLEDFHFQSLHHPISPLFLVNHQQNFMPEVDNLITARLEAGDIQGTLQRIERLWEEQQPELPFQYAFLDRDWAELYDKEMAAREVFGLFSLLAIFIACLGLLALAAFTVEQRTKEIGIRKILGASVAGILGLLSRDFLRLVALALALATPLSWYAMKVWLDGFAYRTTLAWWAFALAGALALGIAFLTVSYHSLRAALGNPVEALRNE